MNLDTERIRRISEDFERGDFIADDDVKYFLGKTKGIPEVLRACGDRYLLVANELMFRRQRMEDWEQVRREIKRAS